MELTAMKASVEHVREKFAFTERRACRLLLVPVSSYRYQARRNDDGLRERLIALAREKPRFGYRRLHVLLEREGEVVNHKRVHRIYREAGLALRRKKRKHCVRVSTPLGVYTAANQEWALDFVHDAVASGRSIRVLNVIDAYTRESLAMEVDTSFAGLRVTRVLDQIIDERGLPRAIRCDNGPELTSRHFLAWALDRKIDLVHIQPGKPTQNAYVESFNSKLREECLRVSWFQNLFEARRIMANWRRDYNQNRPHSSLCYMTPAEFAARASRGKDADKARLKNDTAVFHFPTATAAAAG
jgi:putative transposase